MAEIHARHPARLVAVAGRPIGNLLLPIPILCFLGAVLTDWSYLGSGGNLTWLFFSTWLIPVGLVFGGLTALFLLIDGIRVGGGRWIALGLLAAAWIVELFNALIHMRDGWTAVAGAGFILSIIGTLLALAAGWFAADDRRVLVREEA